MRASSGQALGVKRVTLKLRRLGFKSHLCPLLAEGLWVGHFTPLPFCVFKWADNTCQG